MRILSGTAKDGSGGIAHLVVCAFVGLALWISPASLSAQTSIVQASWAWPDRVHEHNPLVWSDAVLDALEWWLGVPLARPDAPLEQQGRARVVVEERTGGWGVRYDQGAVPGERADLHRASLPEGDQESIVFAEVMIDLNALRRVDPQRAGWGSGARVMRLWRLSNAREVMLHFRTSPRPSPLPLVVSVEATWSVRSEPPSIVHSMMLTQHLGLVEAVQSVPEGTAWVAALSWDARTTAARMLGTAIAAREQDEAFEREALRWAVQSRDRITRLDAVLTDRVLLAGSSQGVAVRIPLRRIGQGRSVAEDLAAMQARLGPSARRDADALAGGILVSERTRWRWWIEDTVDAPRLAIDLVRISSD